MTFPRENIYRISHICIIRTFAKRSDDREAGTQCTLLTIAELVDRQSEVNMNVNGRKVHPSAKKITSVSKKDVGYL